MPASLLMASSPTVRGVTRNESTRSDSSAASNTSQSSTTGNKKVSFNNAVRVKKYPRSKKTDGRTYGDVNDTNGSVNGGDEIPGSPGKRFWFKVYKNKHRQSPDLNDLRPKNNVIYYGNDVGADTNGYHDDVISYHPNPSILNYPVFTTECGTQTPNRKTENSTRTALLGNEFTPLHPSQMPSDPPEVRRNYVKRIVNRFNEEAVLQRQRSFEAESGSPQMSPPGSPRHNSTPKHIPVPPPPPPPVTPYIFSPDNLPPQPEGLFTMSRTKKNPIVNGVKVMFGVDDVKNGEDSDSFRRSSPELKTREKLNDNYKYKHGNSTYKTEIALSDGSETDVKSPYPPTDRFLFGDFDTPNVIKKQNGNTDLSRSSYNYEDNGYRDYFDDDNDEFRKRGKCHVEAWDSGNQLVFDTTDVNTETGRTEKGQFMSTVGGKHQMWQNNKRIIVYEEPTSTIIRRKAKSQSDLTVPAIRNSPENNNKLDKGVSTDELFVRKSDKKDTFSKKQKDSWLKHFRSATKDKGVQCDKVPTEEPQELYGFGKYRVLRPRNGTVTSFSNGPKMDHVKQKDHVVLSQVDSHNGKDSVIYSQVDKTKKKNSGNKEKKKFGSLFKSRSEPLYIGPAPTKNQQQFDEEVEGSYYDDQGDRTIKTSKRSFGFRLHPVNKVNGRKSPYHEEDWYNVDGDVEAVERQRRRGRSHRDIAEVRQEIVEEEISDASSLSNGDTKKNGGAGSVMREVDYKKREISYENVPRSDGENNGHPNVGSGLWYRDADEDYRKEMAQNEVSYPAGNSVGSERFYTVDRREKPHKKPPPSPRAYTLDRRHMTKNKDKQKQVPNTSGVKILVNGKEVKDKSSSKKPKRREDPSSVQSDPVSVRGGLAAAYQARQRAAVRRSNSSVSGLSGSRYNSGSSPNIRRIVASDASAASSESESSRHRRPLVMYIPGVNHQEKSSEIDDRVCSTIARSQSMNAPTRPPRMMKKGNQRSHKSSKVDLYRNGDIYEEDEIMPLASDISRKKPPKVPSDSKKHNDIKRRHSMPKDTKFSWLKWKLRGKPSREP